MRGRVVLPCSRLFTVEDFGYLEGKDSLNAVKSKDAEAVLIQKFEVKRRECFCLGTGAQVSGCLS
jgi:hypothetical protein